MILIRLSPVIISFLLLGAHFLRSGNNILVLFCLFFISLTFFRKKWAARLIQIALLAGTIEWILTIIIYVNERQINGEPWIRLIIILGTVALFTALSALVFRGKALKKHYHL